MAQWNSQHRLLVGVGAAAAGIGALAAWRRASGAMDLREKVVLITGGSRGLGLAMAREFAAQGAQLALCARSEDELDRARQDLSSFGRTPYTTVCDVTDQAQVQALIDATIARFGRLDILVNNAGLITVGPIDTMTVEDFERAMNVMFWGIVYTTLASLPHLRQSGEARIVNITSVGAKISVPHLAPYSCAKFAALAFSEGLRAELSGTNIKVVTIAPGLMRTGSFLNAEFKGSDARESVWFALSSSLPGVSMSADRAARQIVESTRRGSSERVLTTLANIGTRFHGMFPGLTQEILGVVNGLLPHGSKRSIETGRQSEVLKGFWMKAATILGRRAAARFLQPGVS